MERYQIDPNTIIEETGKIVVHNYPPLKHTLSYITRIYRYYSVDKPGYTEAEGEPIYFYDMPNDLELIARFIAEGSTLLDQKLPKPKWQAECNIMRIVGNS